MDKKPTVLIVDDEKDIRDMVRIKLESSGFKVDEAENGKEGIEKAKKIKPDLILLDIVMPVMDGVDTLIEIKKDEDIKNTKVFLFTSKGDAHPVVEEEDQKFVKDSGAEELIRKEINLDELAKKLQDALK